jgi:predicted component of type VI protein secretion system
MHLAIPTDALALAGLRELASSLLPGVPLETTGDVARLLTKLHDLVETFCRCFVALRDTHLQVASAAGIGEASRRMGGSQSAARVQTARDAQGVAAAVLDWRNHDFDAARAVEAVLVDVVAHQAAVIDGVMRGVDSLLAQLSPAAIEADAQAQARGGLGALLGQHRALWQTYEERFAYLADDGRRFELVFGSEFAASYREYRLGHSTES